MKRFLAKIQSEIGGSISNTKEKKSNNYLNDNIDYSVSPLMYNGHVVTTHKELKDLIKLDSFEEVIHGHIRAIREKEYSQNVPEVDRDPCNKIDPKFF